MKKNIKKIIPLALSALLALSCLAGCGESGATDKQTEAGAWNTVSGTLATKLNSNYQFAGMEELKVGEIVKNGSIDVTTSDTEATLKTEARSVSHGNLYTAYATVPLYGNIYKGNTVIICFAVKNAGEGATNFLVDIYGKGEQGKRVRKSWLTRTPIISPNGEYTEYYFYGIATEDTAEALVEINLGFAGQELKIDYIQAAQYNGSIQERHLEKLPLMSRKGKTGNDMYYDWHDYDAAWRETAESMIEKNRKNDITVTVKDASGKTVNGATVQFEQLTTTYQYGTSAGASSFRGNEEQVKSRIAEMADYYNIVTFANDLKWGDPNFANVGTQESNLNSLKALKDSGIGVHGHVLFWSGTGRDPYDDGIDNTAEFTTVPPFIRDTTYIMAAMQRMRGRVTQRGFTEGYGDGTVKYLKEQIETALASYEQELSGKRNPDDLTKEQINTLKTLVQELNSKIEGLADSAKTFDGLNDTLASFQTALKKIVIDHVKDFATYYGSAGSIVEWDVINEAMNEGNRGVFNAIDEDAYMDDVSKVCQDSFYVDIFKAAREAAGPNIKLSYNDTSWQSNGQQRVDTYNFFKYLKDNDAPIDYFGLQAYIYPQSIKAHVTPQALWEEYDKLKDLGMETEITEYSITGWNDVFDTQTQLQQLQADFTCDYILANFAHETSIGFIGWGGLPSSGPVASAWYKLAYNRLWTNDVVTTENGTATVDGFLGNYKITVTKDGKTASKTVSHLSARKDGNGTVVEITLS